MASTRFNVVLEVELTKAQKAAIEKDINAAVVKNLAKIDFASKAWGQKTIPRKEWLGKWLRLFKTQEALKNSISFKATGLR